MTVLDHVTNTTEYMFGQDCQCKLTLIYSADSNLTVLLRLSF